MRGDEDRGNTEKEQGGNTEKEEGEEQGGREERGCEETRREEIQERLLIIQAQAYACANSRLK